jgi:hypothetical protein
MRCTPEAVSTIPLTWPGCKAKAASSNSFCISLRPKKPLQAVSNRYVNNDTRKHSQVTLLASTAAVGLGDCKVTEGDLSGLDSLLVSLEDLNCLLFCASNFCLLPAAGTTTVAVLDEQVAAANLALALA